MKWYRRTPAPAALICLFTLAGCMTSLAEEPRAMSPTARSLTVTQKEDGKQIVLAAGETLVLRLEAIPGTGYGWQVVKDAVPQLETIGKKFLEPAGDEKDRAGGVQEEVFQFRAVTTGSNELVLHYRRSWEREVPPAKTYRIHLIVQ